MFKNTIEFIKRSTIDAVPEKIKNFKDEQSQKGLKYYWYMFCMTKELEKYLICLHITAETKIQLNKNESINER